MNPRDFITIELVVLLAMLYVLYRTVRPWALSPVWLLLGGYLVLAVAGRYLLQFCTSPLQWLLEAPTSQLSDTLAYFLYVCIAFGAGALLWILSMQPEVAPISSIQRIERPEPGALWIWGMLAPLLIYVGAYGPSMLHRMVYLTTSRLMLQIASRSLIPFGVALAGALCVSTRNRFYSILAILTTLGYFVGTFAMSTRMMALVPALFALGALGARPDLRAVRWMPVVGLVLSLVLLPVPLYLRELPDQGLIPFIHALSKIGQSLKGRGTASALMGNVLFGFPLTNHIGKAYTLPRSYLWTDFNPLPGRLTDWYHFQPMLMMNWFTPYNTLGELLNYGYVFAGTFYLLIGFYFAHLECSIRDSTRRGRSLVAILLFGFPALFIILTLEYPLRSCSRLVYYSMAFEAAIWFLLPERTGGRALTLTVPRLDQSTTTT